MVGVVLAFKCADSDLVLVLTILPSWTEKKLRACSGFVGGVFSNALSTLWKWLWSLQTSTKTAISGVNHPVLKFESVYAVKTVFDGSKVGIEPFAVEVSPRGDLLVLDSANSNM